MGAHLKPVKVHLDGVLSLKHINYITQLGVIHMPWLVFQEDLSRDLTRHRGKVDQSVVPRVLLPYTPFKNGSDVSLFPVIKDFDRQP